MKKWILRHERNWLRERESALQGWEGVELMNVVNLIVLPGRSFPRRPLLGTMGNDDVGRPRPSLKQFRAVAVDDTKAKCLVSALRIIAPLPRRSLTSKQDVTLTSRPETKFVRSSADVNELTLSTQTFQ